MPYTSPSTGDPLNLHHLLQKRVNTRPSTASLPLAPGEGGDSDDKKENVGSTNNSARQSSTNIHGLSLDLQPPVTSYNNAHRNSQVAQLQNSTTTTVMTPTSHQPIELLNSDLQEIINFARESTQAYSYAQLSQNSLALRLNVLKRSLEILSERPELFISSNGEIAPPMLPGGSNQTLQSDSSHRTNTSGSFNFQNNASTAALSAFFRQGQQQQSQDPRSSQQQQQQQQGLDVSSPTVKKLAAAMDINASQSTYKQQLGAIETVASEVKDIIHLLDSNHVDFNKSNQPQSLVTDLHDLSLLNLNNSKQEGLKIRLLHALATPFVENISGNNSDSLLLMERRGTTALSLTSLQYQAQQQQQHQQYQQPSNAGGRPFHSVSTNKKITPQAIFTCEMKAPWSMKAANDLACLMFGVSRSSLRAFTLMDLIASRSRDFVLNKLMREIPNNSTVFAGEIIAIQRPNNNFAWTSVWGKRKENMIILIFDQIPCYCADLVISKRNDVYRIDSIVRHNDTQLFDDSIVGADVSAISTTLAADIENLERSVDVSAHIKQTRYYTIKMNLNKNIPSAITAVTLDSSDSKQDTPTVKLNIHSMPYIAGTIVISSKEYHIISYNAAACKNLFGYSDDLTSKEIEMLVPNFTKLLRYAAFKDHSLQNQTGLVLPEHYFRRIASLIASDGDEDEAEFLFLNSDGLVAKHRDGSRFKIDVQLRVTSSETYMLWVTYSSNLPTSSSSSSSSTPSSATTSVPASMAPSSTSSPAQPRRPSLIPVSDMAPSGDAQAQAAALALANNNNNSKQVHFITDNPVGNRSFINKAGDDPMVSHGMKHREMDRHLDLPSQMKLFPSDENEIQSCGSSTDGLSRSNSLKSPPLSHAPSDDLKFQKRKQRSQEFGAATGGVAGTGIIPALTPTTPLKNNISSSMGKVPSLSSSTNSSAQSTTTSLESSTTPPHASEYRSPVNATEFQQRSIHTIELNGSVQKRYSEKELLEAENEAIKETEKKSSLWPREVGLKRREKKLSDFLILKNMGEGAYGKVVQVQHREDLYYKLIIKCIVKERILVDTWVRDRKLGTIPSEIQIMFTLNKNPHPNIMRIVDFFEDTDYYYLETPQHGDPPGIDLFDLIELQSSMSEMECKFIFRQIVQAVYHLHKNGIIHRDIKDENIIIDNKGIIKLIDFGSASYVRNGPFDVFVGTIDYASPEVLNGKPYEGQPQDVWAMGVLLYTLIYKENPFYNVDEIMEGELRLPFVTSDECVSLITRILDRDITKRPSMKEIMEDPWLSF